MGQSNTMSVNTKFERDLSQNERYRDYSPGNIVIKTPNVPFSALHLKEVHKMFESQPENYPNVNIHHMTDSNLLSRIKSYKNTYHISQNMANGMFQKSGPTIRPFNVSNYKVKSCKKHSKGKIFYNFKN